MLIDFQKAFDSVSWKFLYSILTSIGIDARSFNIDRSSHRTADIDTHYQHFNIEITYNKHKNYLKNGNFTA